MRWVTKGQGWASATACLLGLGCGGGEAADGALFQPAPLPMEPIVAPPPPEGDPEPEEMPTVTPPEEMPSDTTAMPPVEEEVDPNAPCRPANGVIGRPSTISEAIILLNTLPKPVTLACFLQALDRPLTLYMTKSDDSLQPAPDEFSPRTFILNGDLEMSIVFGGSASNTLEFGYRPVQARSIKAEVAFPLTDVSERSLFDRVQVTERTTKCGACHVGEAHEDFPGFPLGVFASDIIEPFDMEEVSIETMKAQAASCDVATDEYRCGLLSALFDQGEVVPGKLRAKE
jgi:hypothetical protein